MLFVYIIFSFVYIIIFQIQRLAREERDMLTHQVNTLTTQVDAQHQVVRKLEEKERLLQTNLAAMDKELSMRQQAMEMHKRKAIESAQSAADLKLHLEKYHAQIKEMQQTVAEKTSSLEAEAFKTKRLQEDLDKKKFQYHEQRKENCRHFLQQNLILESSGISERRHNLRVPSQQGPPHAAATTTATTTSSSTSSSSSTTSSSTSTSTSTSSSSQPRTTTGGGGAADAGGQQQQSQSGENNSTFQDMDLE